MTVTVGEDGEVYDWSEDWVEMPDAAEAAIGWAHHGLGVTRSGEVVGFHPERPEVLVFDREGRLTRSLPVAVKEGHGITVVEEDGEERIWLADPGSKMRRGPSGAYEADAAASGGQVVQLDLAGIERRRLDQPPHPLYEAGRYAPTAVAVDETRRGGSGDIWVADGYGQSLVHRYDAGGTYRATLTGDEGAGRFACPHGVFIDRRKSEPELWVADRTNGRVQVYDLEGRFRRLVGDDFLNSPSAFASYGEHIVVGELRARLAVLGPDDQLICYLGENGEVTTQAGWPNRVDDHEHAARTDRLRAGRFNSPHGLAVDADGNLYVAEWLIGGRMVKLVKAAI